jgi:putative transposase
LGRCWWVTLLADLGIGRTRSRPRVSNDNPFSESEFKTLTSPERFGSIQTPGYSAPRSSTTTTTGTITRGSGCIEAALAKAARLSTADTVALNSEKNSAEEGTSASARTPSPPSPLSPGSRVVGIRL